MAKQQTIVFKVSDNIKDKMIKYYEDMKDEKTPPYAEFQVKDFDCVTTLYESGKVMFQGIGADIEASIWTEQERILNNRVIDTTSKEKDKKDKDKEDKITYYNISTIGSDEVGTGDYFGPVVVSAAYVDIKYVEELTDMGVKDSKKMTDEKIMEVAPKLIKMIPSVTYVLDNKSYNANYSSDINMNKIKAILHNKALLSLLKKDNYNYQKIVVDQFVYPKKYYEHLKDASETVKNITFTTKAEEKCLSVAVASVISRYKFLLEMDRMGKELGVIIPKGAGTLVDEFGKNIVIKYGESKLKDIAKINFKNTDKIKELVKNN